MTDVPIKPAYLPGIKWVEHPDGRHPDTEVFRSECPTCDPENWDGIPTGWLEDENDA